MFTTFPVEPNFKTVLSFTDFFIMIKSVDSDFNFRCDIFQYIDKKPVHVREITVAEIVGKEK